MGHDLVVRRFLAVFYPPFAYDETVMEAAIVSEIFAASCCCLSASFDKIRKKCLPEGPGQHWRI
ncbi:MAG: hypothetical protein SCK57_14630 [Bacillota bacterium]|nr:hypothetical protein [Bacillota bacterium]MDW7678884.1 hypothetical protein [Bacillota bacterium]